MSSNLIPLPPPRYTSDVSLEQALLKRRSIRDYRPEPLTLPEVSQLLWAAQGVTGQPGETGAAGASGFRTAPSAGALFALEVYAAVGNVAGLPPGIYRYLPDNHSLMLCIAGDKRPELCLAALAQPHVQNAAIVIIFTVAGEQTTSKYGPRGWMYLHMQAGHAAQNVQLQGVALKLGSVPVAAFEDEKVRRVVNLERTEQPLYLVPVGRV